MNKRYIAYAVVFSLLITSLSASEEKPQKPTRIIPSPITLTAGALATTAVIAGLTAYFKAKNREVTTIPTDLNLTCFGNEQGEPVIYSHGFGGNLSDIFYYTKQNNPFQPHYLFDPDQYHIATFNYPDSTEIRREVKYDQVTLAQNNDINRLNEAVNQFERDSIVGFGISRGAATFINMMGIKKNPKIKALILEAPFATISDVLSHFVQQTPFLYYIPLLGPAAHKLASALFPQYRENGPAPINSIDMIDPKIPILLIHSKEDVVTPPDSSQQLYIKRKQQGCNNVYLLGLTSGPHTYCLWRKEDNVGELFQNVVNAFLKKHGFAHNKELADKVDLKNYQPTIKEVLERV